LTRKKGKKQGNKRPGKRGNQKNEKTVRRKRGGTRLGTGGEGVWGKVVQ